LQREAPSVVLASIWQAPRAPWPTQTRQNRPTRLCSSPRATFSAP
jgi:hypothetical protein